MNVVVRLICPVSLVKCLYRDGVPATVDATIAVCGFDCAQRFAKSRRLIVNGVSTTRDKHGKPESTRYSTCHEDDLKKGVRMIEKKEPPS